MRNLFNKYEKAIKSGNREDIVQFIRDLRPDLDSEDLPNPLRMLHMMKMTSALVAIGENNEADLWRAKVFELRDLRRPALDNRMREYRDRLTQAEIDQYEGFQEFSRICHAALSSRDRVGVQKASTEITNKLDNPDWAPFREVLSLWLAQCQAILEGPREY